MTLSSLIVYAGAAPAAPLAPSLAAAGAITGAIIIIGVAFLATLAAKKVYELTVGAALDVLERQLNRIPYVKIGTRTAGLLNQAIRGGLNNVLNAEAAMASRLFAGLTWVVETTYDVMADGFAATYEAIKGLKQGDVPTQIIQRTTTLVKQLGVTRAEVRRLVTGQVAGLVRRVAAVERDLDRVFGLARRGIDSVEKLSLPRVWRELGALRARVTALGRSTGRSLDRRLSTVEKLVLGGALTAAVLATLTRYMPWWRCASNRRVQRAFCNYPLAHLDNLLGLLLAFTTTFGVVEYAKVLQEFVGVTADVIDDRFDDTDDQLVTTARSALTG